MSHHWARITKDEWKRVQTVLSQATSIGGFPIEYLDDVDQEDLDEGPDEFPSGTPTLQKTEAPPVPTGLTVVVGIDVVSIVWDQSTDPNIEYYQLQIAHDSGFSDIHEFLSTKSTAHTHQSEPGVKHWVRVRSVSKWGVASKWANMGQAASDAHIDEWLEFSERIDETPSVVQTRTANAAGAVAGTGELVIQAAWSPATTEGNHLLAVLTTSEEVTITPPDGWVLVMSVGRTAAAGAPPVTGKRTVNVYQIPNAASRSGFESFTIAGATLDAKRIGTLQLLEIDGIVTNVVPIDRQASAQGFSPSPSVNGGTTREAEEYWMAVVMNNDGAITQASATAGFASRSVLVPHTGDLFRVGIYDRTTVATAVASFGLTLSTSAEWVAIIITLKGKQGGDPPTPGTDLVQLYAKNFGGAAGIFYQNESGRVFGPLGRLAGIRVPKNVNQSIGGGGAFAIITLSGPDFDTDGFFDDANDVFRVPSYFQPGSLFLVILRVQWEAPGAGGEYAAQIQTVAGNTGDVEDITDRRRVNTTATAVHSAMTEIMRLNPGDAVRFRAAQNSGASQNLGGDGTRNRTYAEMWFLGVLPQV